MKTKELQELGEWKVGQKVLVIPGAGSLGSERIVPIVRITDGRDGTIYTENQAYYAIDGRAVGGNSFSAPSIRIATEEDFLRIRGKNAAFRLSEYKWSKLPSAKVIEIEKWLNDNGIDTRIKT